MLRALLRAAAALMAAAIALFFIVLSILVIQNLIGKNRASSKDRVAVVDLTGVLFSASHFDHTLDKIRQQKNIKAVVIRINSPGGVVGPSQEMYQAVRRLDEKIPVVISMESLAASGGYYVALGGREIFAEPGTLTGSIGVIMEFANTEGLYQWAKIKRYVIKAGRFKDIGSSTRAMLPEERALLENMLQDVDNQFRSTVKSRRHLTDSELDSVADGRVLTGNQAKQAKLIDKLGGFQAAVDEAKKLASLPESAPVDYSAVQHGLLYQLVFGSSDDEDEDSSLSQFAQNATEALSALSPSALSGKVLWLAPIH